VEIRNKKILVLGLGRSGFAAADLLINNGALVTGIDAKAESDIKTDLRYLRKRGAKIIVGENSLKVIEDKELLVVSPGVPVEHPLIQRAKTEDIPVIGELELAYRFCQAELIAVTGTNGKSTTTSLIAHILQTAGVDAIPVGNIGVPLSSVVSKKHNVLVVEVSSYQLETIEKFKPHIAVWLNLTEDHLQRHMIMENYVKIKSRIFGNQDQENFLVFNADNKWVAESCQKAESRLVPFSFKNEDGVYYRDGAIWINYNDKKNNLILTDEIRIKGRHNIENCLASVGTALAYGVKLNEITKSLRNFRGIEHRQEFVTSVKGVSFINDSKATNVDSGLQALDTIPKPIILIAGGRGKGESFTPILKYMPDKVKLLITIGESAEQLTREMNGSVEIMYAADMKKAVQLAYDNASPDDNVLLSPMCASFDMYEDFEDRGRHFKKCVHEVTGA